MFIYKGWFPATAGPVEDRRFSLVHLDVDLYQSTLDALDFFYGRLVRGAVLISHDYNSISCPGVSKAFKEFLADKDEAPIEMGGTSQCIFVKL